MTAVLSDCGRYRYALTRGNWLDGVGTVLFVMLNPSTADATEDDPTIRRCIRFARDWGYARLAVANLYAFRATDPRDLALAGDPIGPENDEWLERLSSEANMVVVAWGANRLATPARVDRVLQLLGWSTCCLGTTKDGAPQHPLRLAATTAPRRFAPIAHEAPA
jgi:hypothetical protein